MFRFKVFLLFITISFYNIPNVSCLTLSDSLKSVLIKVKSDEDKFDTLLKLAQNLNGKQNDQALNYSNQALLLAKSMDDQKLIAKANLELGSVFFNQGNYKRAIEYYYNVLEYHETNNNRSDLIATYFNIALVYGQLKDNKKSQEYYFKALHTVEAILVNDSSILNRFPVGRIYNNIGITFNDNQDYEMALEYYYKGLKISEETNNTIALPFLYNNIGIVYKEKGDYQIAQSFYLKSLNFRKETNDTRGLAVTNNYMADCYVLMKEFSKAITHYEQALELCRVTNYIDMEKTVAETLVNLYAEINDYKKSYEMHLLFKRLSDSININESLKTAGILEMQYLFDKQQKEIELEEQKKSFRNLIIFILMGALLLVTSLLYFLTQSKITRVKLQRSKLKLEKEKLEDELDYKNKELTTNVMYLVRKNELINSISSKLLELKKSMLKANQKPIQNIIMELQKSVDNDVWQEFEFRFKDVHETFYKKLNERFPDLTPNEKKLCAFLRLNMSTKEISAITFQTPHSITIARSRLRKKLDLTNQEVNLVDFLSKIDEE